VRFAGGRNPRFNAQEPVAVNAPLRRARNSNPALAGRPRLTTARGVDRVAGMQKVESLPPFYQVGSCGAEETPVEGLRATSTQFPFNSPELLVFESLKFDTPRCFPSPSHL